MAYALNVWSEQDGKYVPLPAIRGEGAKAQFGTNEQGDITLTVTDNEGPHTVTFSPSAVVSERVNTYLASLLGQPNGIAVLDANGKLPGAAIDVAAMGKLRHIATQCLGYTEGETSETLNILSDSDGNSFTLNEAIIEITGLPLTRFYVKVKHDTFVSVYSRPALGTTSDSSVPSVSLTLSVKNIGGMWVTSVLSCSSEINTDSMCKALGIYANDNPIIGVQLCSEDSNESAKYCFMKIYGA